MFEAIENRKIATYKIVNIGQSSTHYGRNCPDRYNV